MIASHSIVLSLGSNQGNRLHNLTLARAACNSLFEQQSIASAIYQTEALLPENAPENWNIPYYNACLRFNHIQESPDKVMHHLLNIENTLGRVRNNTKWAPRIIDIDILVFGNMVIKNKALTLPHYDLLNRSFFLEPLAEIYPDWHYPLHGHFYHKSALELSELIGHNPLAGEQWNNG